MHRVALILPLALALFALSATAPAATHTYSSGQLHAAIPDDGTLVKSIQVPDRGPLSFVAVGVRIKHPRDSDLTLTLVSPAGTEIPLSTHKGGTSAGAGSGCSENMTWFEDDGDPSSTLSGPLGEVRPDQPLAALYGQEARGRWSLRIADDKAGAAGTLLCWQLELSRNVVSHARAASDGVSADLSYRETNGRFGSLTIAVRRHGVLTLAAPMSRFACRICAASGYNTLFDHPVSVRDLDGDGEPEVLVDLFTGGAHCCYWTAILHYDGHTYRGNAVLWGDPGYELRDLDGNGRLELLTSDDRFAYAFSAYVFSVLPVQVDRYDHGRIVDVTSQYPWLVRREAKQLWRLYLQTRGEKDADVRGVLAAWLADEYRLGLVSEGWAKIEAAYHRGDLGAPRVDTLWPAGQKYLSALRSFLEKTGYAR